MNTAKWESYKVGGWNYVIGYRFDLGIDKRFFLETDAGLSYYTKWDGSDDKGKIIPALDVAFGIRL